jgi:diphthamide synthase (EF-2-diphthine--ammonia ligase)
LSKRKSKEFLESIPEGKRVVTHKVAHDVARCFDELMNNSLAWSLYTERTHAEVSIFFELNGLGVKVRPDLISMGGILCDYKCTRKKDILKTFPSVVREYQYGLSEALYVEGCRQAGIASPPMNFIVFSLANYECQVMTLPRSYIRSEHDRLLRLIDDYQRRQETGDWETREGYGTVHEMQMFFGNGNQGGSDG